MSPDCPGAECDDRLDPFQAKALWSAIVAVAASRWWLFVCAATCSVAVSVGGSAAESSVYRARANVVTDPTTIFYAFLGLDDQLAYGLRDPAVVARDPAVLKEALATVEARTDPDALLATSSVRQLFGGSHTIEVAVDAADPKFATRLATAYARATARRTHELDVADARRVLPRLRTRLRIVQRAKGASSQTRDLLEHQLVLLTSMRYTSTARPEAARSAAKIWPRPISSAFLAATLSLAFTLGLALLGSRLQEPAGRRVTGITAASLAGAVAFGLGSVWTEGSAARAFGLTTLASIPFLVALSALALPVLATIVVFAQVLEGYELRTPVATLSLGVVALLILLLSVWRDLLALFRYSVVRIVGAAVVALVAAHALQLLHVSAGVTLRGLVTAGSIALFWLAGLYLTRRPWGMAAAGIAAVLALSVLGVAAVGVAAHVLPQSSVISGGRSFLGLQSPFPRTYGLSVGGLPALFLPLSIPWLTIVTLNAEQRRRKLAALATIVALFLFIVLFFQSRSMLLEIVVGVTLTAVAFRGRPWLRFLGAGAMVVAVTVAIPSLLFATDRLSTGDRLQSYRLALEYFGDRPMAIFVGTDPAALARHINATLVPPQPPNAPIHNMPIQFLAEGGILATSAALAVILIPITAWSLVVSFKRTLSLGPTGAWIPAVAAMLAIEMMSYAFFGNAGNAWLALGMMTGYSALLWAEYRASKRRSATQRRGVPAPEPS